MARAGEQERGKQRGRRRAAPARGRQVRAWCEPLESRMLLNGLTIIVHGFNSSASGWVDVMAGALAARAGGASAVSEYTVRITNNSGPVLVDYVHLDSGPDLYSTGHNGEAIIKLDWSDVAGLFPTVSTTTVAQALADYLLNTTIGGHSWLEGPMHLIGHSRGASLVAELAGDLGSKGVWVDQMTLLDPNFATFWDPSSIPVFSNVRFADDYYQQTASSTPDGSPINGTFQRQLTTLSGGYSNDHSDVHAWYFGTINPATPAPYADGVTLDATLRSTWWTAGDSGGQLTGWHYSRLGDGVQPAAGLVLAGAARTPVTLGVSDAAAWDNIELAVPAALSVARGASASFTIRYQDRNGDGTITLGCDSDGNPYNGTGPVFYSAAAAGTGAGESSFVAPWDTATVLPGAYRVFARITGGGGTRYYYLTDPLTVTPLPEFQGTAADDTFRLRLNGTTVEFYENVAVGGPPSFVLPASLAGTIDVHGRGGADRLEVESGSYRFAVDLGVENANLAVQVAAGSVDFDATEHLAGLDVAAGSQARLTAGGPKVLVAVTLSVAGTLDLTDNDLLTQATALASVTDMVRDGPITSAAAGATGGLTGLAVSSGLAYHNRRGAATLFAGQTVQAADVLVKYTYRGDANLDGAVALDDYLAIDSGWRFGGTTYTDGNFDYSTDGVTAADYVLIDRSYRDQGAALSAGPTVFAAPAANQTDAAPLPVSGLPLLAAALSLRPGSANWVASGDRKIDHCPQESPIASVLCIRGAQQDVGPWWIARRAGWRRCF